MLLRRGPLFPGDACQGHRAAIVSVLEKQRLARGQVGCMLLLPLARRNSSAPPTFAPCVQLHDFDFLRMQRNKISAQTHAYYTHVKKARGRRPALV
jgi:hypothetical protein